MDCVEAVRSIPEGIWGVIIGSALAFGGTWTATRAQLRHDARQRERERQMQLRRDVFLEAAEGVAGTVEYFMRFANVDIPITDVTSSNVRPGWLNKLYTVASLGSIEAFSDASATLGASAFDLFRRRLPLEDIKGKLAAANQQIEMMKVAQQGIREAAATLNNQPPTPDILDRLNLVQQHWEQSWAELERLNEIVAALLAQRVRLQRELLETAVSYSSEYQKKLRKALVALRTELDIPIDQAKFETSMGRIDAEMLQSLRRYLTRLMRTRSKPAA